MKAKLIFEKEVNPSVIVRVLQLENTGDYQICMIATNYTKHSNAYSVNDAIKICHKYLDDAKHVN